MKKILLFTALAFLTIISCQEQETKEIETSAVTKPKIKDNSSNKVGSSIDMSKFTKVWSDDFTSDQLDTKIWERQVMEAKYEKYNDVVITKLTNSSVDDTDASGGVLVVAIRKTSTKNTYSRGLVRANDAYAQKYGYFEARIWLPYPYGYQGAFWMMPINNVGMDCYKTPCSTTNRILNSATDGAEIDIIEGTGGATLNTDEYKYSTNIHMDGYFDGHRSSHLPVKGASKVYGAWHTYGVHWTSTFIRWYMDGVCTRETLDDKLISDVKQEVILSTGIITNGWDGVWKPETLPVNMLVDWVKVWK